MNPEIAEELEKILAEPDDGTSWDRVDLVPVLAAVKAGETLTPAPSMVRMDTGKCVMYPGTLTSLAAPPDSGKGMFWAKASADVMADGKSVICVDLEENAENRIARLLSIGVPELTIRDRFAYFRPWDPIGDPTRLDGVMTEHQPAMAILDSVGEGMAVEGLNPLDNSDAAKWINTYARYFQRHGCAVLIVDHQVKNKDDRGRYAIGAQHKLAVMDLALTLEVVEPMGRGKRGRVKITWAKDRPGFWGRGHHADMVVNSTGDTIDITIEQVQGIDTDFRPTARMESVSRLIEANPGIGKDEIRQTVGGRASITDDARTYLVSDGFVEARQEGRKTGHFSITPYRENDRTVSPNRPTDRDGSSEAEHE